LIGVLNADSTLALPDFRAGERTFDLLHQVAGRAGRYRDDGLVIIQTMQPTAPAILMAAQNDLERFYEMELSQRRETMFPPFTRLVNLTIRGKDEAKVQKASDSLEEAADAVGEGEAFRNIEVFSSSPCLIEKQASQYRYHVLLRSNNIAELLTFTRTLLSLYKVPSGVHLEIDVDPSVLL
ncbi:MAG: primosomal protein N', partial [Spirochaetales bacterium]|nr:primosomal protein N' [Candidatus Physcosoma equi]